jgi:carboxypeptidase Taq
LTDHIRRGELSTLREWLRTNIHQHGQQFRAGELVRRVTGEPLSTEPFMRYIRAKFAPIYGL